MFETTAADKKRQNTDAAEGQGQGVSVEDQRSQPLAAPGSTNGGPATSMEQAQGSTDGGPTTSMEALSEYESWESSSDPTSATTLEWPRGPKTDKIEPRVGSPDEGQAKMNDENDFFDIQ